MSAMQQISTALLICSVNCPNNIDFIYFVSFKDKYYEYYVVVKVIRTVSGLNNILYYK